MKLYRFLGKRGRTTIPLPLRKLLDLRSGDLLSFAETEDGMGVIVRPETVCDDCLEDALYPDLDEEEDERRTISEEKEDDGLHDGRRERRRAAEEGEDESLRTYIDRLTPQQQKMALMMLSMRIAYPCEEE